MYQALYRKYRPVGFESVVGQNTIIKTLQNSVKNKTFSHAYMFFGPRGVGKTTVSKIFARAINCLDPIDGNACGKCKNCLHSFEKECVDIIEIDAASNNGVDEIRELKNKISLVPGELKYKVYIIDEVHMLSIGAFNALLKTLEEPPAHAIFILATTDPQKVPETIISRCQCFSFKRISNDMIVKRLKEVCSKEKIEIDDDVLLEIAMASDGGMRDSLGALDKLTSYTNGKISLEDFAELNGIITKSMLHEFCSAIFNKDISTVLFLLNKYSNDGKNLIQILLQLMNYLRNSIVNYYINSSEIEYDLDEMLMLVNIINEKIFDIKKSGNPHIYIEMILIKFIKENEKGNTRENQKEEKIISQEIVNNKNKTNLLVTSNSLEKNSTGNVRELDSSANNSDLDIKNEEETTDDEEFDFDKEFSDDISDGYNNENLNAVRETDSLDNSSDNNEQCDDDTKNVLNMCDIIAARVNNTMACADKSILNQERENMKKLQDFTFDQEIGYIVCSLLDSKIEAASKDNMIISYEYDSTVKQNLMQLDKIMYVYEKITGSNKKIAIITNAEWEQEKKKYIVNLRKGVQYNIIEEPVEIYEETKKNDIISNRAMELFGDIVEIVE